MTKEDINEIVKNIDEKNVLFGTDEKPVYITSLNAIDYLMFSVYDFHHLDIDVTVYIPTWYYLKLIMYGDNIIRKLVLELKPLRIKNIIIKVYKSEYSAAVDYIYIKSDQEYICKIQFCAEP